MKRMKTKRSSGSHALECAACGFISDSPNVLTCPKCDECFFAETRNTLYEVDAVHAGEDAYVALDKIRDAISQAHLQRCKGLKVIHGHGTSHGHTSFLKSRIIAFLKKYAREHGHRLASDRYTDGAHILYF